MERQVVGSRQDGHKCGRDLDGLDLNHGTHALTLLRESLVPTLAAVANNDAQRNSAVLDDNVHS